MKLDKIQKQRRVYQGISFSLALGFLALVILGGRFVIHQACPYAIVCFGLSRGNFFQLSGMVMIGAIIAGLGILVHSMFWGRMFCGWLCPLGTLQERIYMIRKPKYCLKHKLPVQVDRKYDFIKDIVLLATVILAILGLGYVFMQTCPFFALSQLPRIAIAGLVLLLGIIVTSFYGSRLWCRFLCPYAALMNFFQWLGEKVGVCRKIIKRDLNYCTQHGICELFCPMNIYITEKEYIHNHNCIHCGLCTHYCPQSDIILSKEFICPK